MQSATSGLTLNEGITIANLFSAVIGIPLAWVVMLAVEFAVMLPVGIGNFISTA